MRTALATNTYWYVIKATGGLKVPGKKRVSPTLSILGKAHASRKGAAEAAKAAARTAPSGERFYVTEAVSGFKRSSLVSYERYDG